MAEQLESESSGSGNLFNKIIAVAAGEAHTLALTANGDVYSWGRGTFGRLGVGSEADHLYPVRINFGLADSNGDKRVKIVGITVGAYHSLAVSGHMSTTLPIAPRIPSKSMMDQYGAGDIISVSLRDSFDFSICFYMVNVQYYLLELIEFAIVLCMCY
ncbi:hypothetical protein T459_21529 [Capsicum annuum]|uniref:Uncharacterized protein n=1 Tax=Capsicum annuum TaxID=4072 RepID=A0A2G2YWX4_CAPAN|nr:hypothetical protein T459_21529 [Capsicum annuum]